MADSQSVARFLNPWTLHLQKLGLELKCPLCLKLLNKPVLLPCNHLFCNVCVPGSTQYGSECPVCKHHFVNREMRPAPFIENIVSIYRSLDAAFVANASHSSSSVGRSSEESPISVCSAGEQSAKEICNEQSEKGVIVKPCPSKGLLQNDSRGMILNGENRSNPLAEEMDVNHLPQQSPVSSPSSDDNKDVNVSTHEQDIGKTVDGPDKTANKIHGRNKDDDKSLERDSKRQKKLNYKSSETDNLVGGITGKEVASVPDSSPLQESVCAFCKTSKSTDVTGPMLFYANGKELENPLPDAIPIHRCCIDWAPQVYYDGELLKNVESELARSAKLKCVHCGLKGAALGCYMKSCKRTYHMPCAFQIQECRWDLGNYLMLCPSHCSTRFPNEKPKSKKRAPVEKHRNSCIAVVKHIKPSKPPAEQFNFWGTSPDGPKKWVLCGSALSAEEKYTMVEFAKMSGASVSKFWTSDVTHVIAATDAEGACTRTLKVLMAILGGKWILTMDWVRACMEANSPVNEEPYEITSDNHGCSGGPKTGRLNASTNAPKLFGGLKFYISGEFLAPYLKDLLELVHVAGGTIVKTKEQLFSEKSDSVPGSCLIVYNCDPPRGCPPSKECSVLLQRFAEADDIAKQTGSLAIKHTWILESIAACKLVPFVC